jgi:hypothetical protein
LFERQIAFAHLRVNRRKIGRQDRPIVCVLRNWQKSDRTLWRAKNTDTWKPMGPWIETEARLDDMETRVRVNGTETTRFRTNDMLFGVATFTVLYVYLLTVRLRVGRLAQVALGLRNHARSALH